ncbi:Wzz/FepE/Etk N-terminal domain-containing protein [Parapedobacter tibetensis]|uniref:Wzz/FepE/Etk N-terminal domain-containing protein n=1 Tax=Parapedobacter tibetensis TaxID=2972951 RepID=UPI00214DF090|nr:Wzz/FepE/Etk N-terminal domain-containing protein [Parapedobacter tibetensis]
MEERKQTQQTDEISLKLLIEKMVRLCGYLLHNWKVVIGCVVIGGALSLTYAHVKRIQYKAKLSFVVEEQGGGTGTLGAAANIASQFGINLGGVGGSGGFFEGDNIIEFLKSRSMIEKTLLSEIHEDGRPPEMLADRYASLIKLKYTDRLNGFRFRDTSGVYLQDSLITMFYKSILNRHLSIKKPDKRLNIIEIEMKSPDELFSKVFVEKLIENASDFYIQMRTLKAKENLDVLTHQVDSVRKELNAAIRGVAAATDANPNPNRVLQRLRVESQLRTVDVQANGEILKELVANQEMAKITLRHEKPVIQILDRPVLPLDNNRMGWVMAVIIGGFLGGFLNCMVLTLRWIYLDMMAE